MFAENDKFVEDHGKTGKLTSGKFLVAIVCLRCEQPWRSMLEAKRVGDNFKMLITVLAI